MSLRTDFFLKAFFEGTPDLIGVLDADRTLVAANKAFFTEFGYSEGELIGRSADLLYAETDGFQMLARDHFHSGGIDRPELYRATYRRRNNETFVGETRSVVVYDERRAVDGYIGIIRDVSETVGREEFFESVAHLTSNRNRTIGERLTSLLDAARSYVGLQAVALTVTDDLADLFENGRTLKSIDPALSASDPTVADIIDQHLQQTNAKTKNFQWSSEPVVLDGESLGSLSFGKSDRETDNHADRELETKTVLGPAIASQLKLAHQNRALALRESRFRSLYRKTPAIMHSIDTAGNLTEVSDAWLNVLGYEREEVIGQKSSKFLTKESRDYAINKALPEFFAKGFISRVPYTFLTKQGTSVEIELSAHLGHENTSLAVLEDVTERNAAQRELLAKNNALLAANEELKQFAFIASHDLQEPLRKIRAFCDILDEALQSSDTQEIDYAMAVLRKSADRSSRLIKDLLSFSRISNREFINIDFDVGPTIQELLDDMSKNVAGTNADVSMQVDDLTISGDRTAFLLLVENLINNGIKYHRPGTRPQIRIVSENGVTGKFLKVEDNGIGVDPKYSHTIFEPFKRLHPQEEYDGTGIGLAICKKIADRHGWRIALDSSRQTGATFSLSL